jgi:hypothetical protein
MTKIINYGNYFSFGENEEKKQIVLLHTSRKVTQYLTGLKYRFNGKYTKIPNYVIDKEGKILEILEPKKISKMFNNRNLDKNILTISLENLGWLYKEPLQSGYINWIGNIYKGKVYERKWRDYVYWDIYTPEQTESCFELCMKLINEFNIDKKFVGHNTKINGIEKFNGIVSRSNYSSETTDLNPSFDFEGFLKKIEDE